ncbi:hypothetical protein ACI4CV_27345, partial [Klebsiella pneumoniae]|uniref:hypothetical protein n=1 Tax=Klebsiella pneumoniae TaxID=573 RepID=UPI0038536A7C
MLNVKKSLDQHEAFLDIETLDPALVAGFIALAIPARKTKPLEISDYTEGSTDPNYKAKIPEPTILRMPSRLT